MVRCLRRSHEPRQGITLFEVVLALAIFVGAFAAISEILRNGSQAATRSQMASEGALRCENQLNAMLVEAVPLQTTPPTPFEDDSEWQWSANVVESAVPNLFQVEMVVQHVRSIDGSVNATTSLTRLIRNPQIYLDAALTEETL